jgi:hypothetical protein
VRPVVVFWFLSLCPGMILVRYLRLKEPVIEWTFALALSIIINATMTAIQVYAGKWSPTDMLSILIAFSLIGATVQLTKMETAIDNKVYPIIKALKELIKWGLVIKGNQTRGLPQLESSLYHWDCNILMMGFYSGKNLPKTPFYRELMSKLMPEVARTRKKGMLKLPLARIDGIANRGTLDTMSFIPKLNNTEA